jgi:flavin reductase (DIM6/NTAB) family NADH-FMN oxidoreductase RutF
MCGGGALDLGGGWGFVRVMRIDLTTISSRDAYGWMTSTILPRPIAWVSTISAEGKTNLAPFSFFQGITSAPPSLMFVPVNLRDGSKKDSLRNIEATGEFVVNLVSFAQAEAMNKCAALLPYGESEFEKFGIASVAAETVKPLRVAGAPVSFECRLHSITRIGEGAGAANVVFGLIGVMHVDDAVLDADGKVDPVKLDLVARLGGEAYSRMGEIFSLKRPDR